MTPPGALEAYREDRAAGAFGPALMAILPGGVAARKGLKAAAKRSLGHNEMASSHSGMYNPPDKPLRPFSDDYPGAVVNKSGALSHDIEGRPLVARYVAGRKTEGGDDEAISSEEFDAIAEGADGAKLKAVAPGHAKLRQGRYLGFYDRREGIGYVNRDLPADDYAMVAGHELGHHIDTLAGYIPVSRKMREEMRSVYSTLATNQEWRQGRSRTLPQHFGYSGGAADRELVVEAIRAYMANPNYLKTVAPETAKAIRTAVNPNPKLNKIIQFNSNAGIGVLGAGALGAGAVQASDGDDESLGAILTRAMEGR